jgi:hypothetical protein
VCVELAEEGKNHTYLLQSRCERELGEGGTKYIDLKPETFDLADSPFLTYFIGAEKAS